MSNDPDYERLRREYERRLDDDYHAWRQHRAGAAGRGRDAAGEPANQQPANALESWGRAIVDVVTVPAGPDGVGALGRDPSDVGSVQSRQTS